MRPLQDLSSDLSPRLHRRRLGRVASAAGLSTLLGSTMARAAVAGTRSQDARFKRCVTLWMAGGPSQMETFDPKPDSDNGGPLGTVQTSLPGVHFCETLADLAARADDLCLLRSVGSTQGEHERASYLLHTGFERIDSFPRPGFGALVSADRRPSANGSGGETPRFVTLGNQVYGPAYLGAANGPFVINNVEQTRRTIGRVKGRSQALELIRQMNSHSPVGGRASSIQERSQQIDSVAKLIHSPFAKALDLGSKSDGDKSRYGDSDFGRQVLVARRLLEAGVNYVEVQMPGWDTHVGNFPSVKRLCGQLQPAWIALMDDLKSNGLWDETLILWMGEFGRTPVINGQNGRDHYPRSIPVALAGKGIGGRVLGETARDGTVDTPSNSVADLMYTLMTLMGIDPDQQYTTTFGSPTSATEDGSLISGIL